MAKMSPLRRRMIEDVTIRDLAPTTQRSYVMCGIGGAPIGRFLNRAARK